MHNHFDRNKLTPAPGIVNCPIHPLLQKVVDLHLGGRNCPTDGSRHILATCKHNELTSILTFDSCLLNDLDFTPVFLPTDANGFLVFYQLVLSFWPPALQRSPGSMG